MLELKEIRLTELFGCYASAQNLQNGTELFLIRRFGPDSAVTQSRH